MRARNLHAIAIVSILVLAAVLYSPVTVAMQQLPPTRVVEYGDDIVVDFHRNTSSEPRTSTFYLQPSVDRVYDVGIMIKASHRDGEDDGGTRVNASLYVDGDLIGWYIEQIAGFMGSGMDGTGKFWIRQYLETGPIEVTAGTRVPVEVRIAGTDMATARPDSDWHIRAEAEFAEVKVVSQKAPVWWTMTWFVTATAVALLVATAGQVVSKRKSEKAETERMP